MGKGKPVKWIWHIFPVYIYEYSTVNFTIMCICNTGILARIRCIPSLFTYNKIDSTVRHNYKELILKSLFLFLCCHFRESISWCKTVGERSVFLAVGNDSCLKTSLRTMFEYFLRGNSWWKWNFTAARKSMIKIKSHITTTTRIEISIEQKDFKIPANGSYVFSIQYCWIVIL